jgi:hypothetical protein
VNVQFSIVNRNRSPRRGPLVAIDLAGTWPADRQKPEVSNKPFGQAVAGSIAASVIIIIIIIIIIGVYRFALTIHTS